MSSEAALSSSIFYGEVFHQRNTPTLHAFTYPLFTLRVSVDELPELSRRGRGIFSHNKLGIFSVFDDDFLGSKTGNLRERLEKILLDQGVSEKPSQIDLVANPRFLNYVFNPVSFFLCYRLDESLFAVISEVHNTFGEKHLYVLTEDRFEKDPAASSARSRSVVRGDLQKVFHVSPFFDLAGNYRFVFLTDRDTLDIRVSLVKEEKMVFTSRLLGKKKVPWGRKALLCAFFSLPGTIILTMARITYQAALLKFRRKLKVYTKPIAAHPMTIERTGPGILQRLAYKSLTSFLDNIERGQISFRYPDGNVFEKKGKLGGAHAIINVRNYDIFLRTLISGDIGFGESYVDRDWDSEDLVSVIRFFCENMRTMDDRNILFSKFGRLINSVGHFGRRNTISRSKTNIGAHYDLSNDLFSRFLDKNMLYSAGYYASDEDSLETAQLNKMDMLIKRAHLKSSDHLLEIGCGWGALAIRAAKTVGCRVTGITLSEEQKAWAEQRIAEEGLQSQIEIQLVDYRNLTGKYDKIISVEMIEAVGHSFLPTFFNRAEELLKEDGRLVLQAITIPEARYEAYRKGCDWIQKHIFPGGHCPSISALVDAAGERSYFSLEASENIGLHYARTLADWRVRFNANYEEIQKFGFDERFRRMWNYYLAYCEAGFATRMVNTHHLVFGRSSL